MLLLCLQAGLEAAARQAIRDPVVPSSMDIPATQVVVRVSMQKSQTSLCKVDALVFQHALDNRRYLPVQS